jgi:polyhydroxyalkanoate synthesis regulator phasin
LLFALDRNGNRIRPFKGENGICQVCKNDVKAFCGDIYVHHWKHVAEFNCDPWKEHESEWHRSWKNEFPKDWQEALIIKGEEKHLADIQTTNGLVLELQNSSISNSTIIEREEFYKDIYWLLNGAKFKERLKYFEKVQEKLLEFEQSHIKYYPYYSNEDSSEVKNIKAKIDDFNSDYTNLNFEFEKLKSQIKQLNDHIENIEDTTTKYLELAYPLSLPLSEFKSIEKEEFVSTRLKIEVTERDIDAAKAFLIRINDFQNSGIQGHDLYKIVAPSDVRPSSYRNCLLVEKATKDSLFPTIIKFNSEEDFDRMAKNKDYLLIMDLSEKITSLNNNLGFYISALEKLKKAEYNCLTKVKDQLFKFLSESIFIRTSKLESNLEKLNTINQKIESLENRLKQQVQEEADQRELEKEELIEFYNSERSEIISRFKGQYSYRWKHRRPSWDYATGKIFIDFGTFVAQIIDDSTFKKMTKAKFIELVKNWKK